MTALQRPWLAGLGATPSTVIFLGLRHEIPHRPTYHWIFYVPYGSLTASLQTLLTSHIYEPYCTKVFPMQALGIGPTVSLDPMVHHKQPLRFSYEAYGTY